MAKRGSRGLRGAAVAARADQVRRGAARASQRLTDAAATRWRELDGRLPATAADVSVRARRGGWQAVQLAGVGVAGLPSAGFNAAKVAAEALDDARGRSAQLGERARELADEIPPSRRQRRRSRLRTAGVVAVAFSAGAALGWALAQRRADQDTAWLADHLDAPAQGSGPERSLIESEDGVEAAETADPGTGHPRGTEPVGTEREAGE